MFINEDSTDPQLIQACIRGDAKSWEIILVRYERLVFSIPLRFGLTREDAADITQVTFTNLMHSLENLREDTNLKGWLATVARRHTWRLSKANQQEISSEFEEGELLNIATTFGMPVTNQLDQWELAEWLSVGLSQLNERCRELLRLMYLDASEPSYDDIGRRLAIPTGSIGPTRARCLEQLKRKLKD